MLKERYGVYRTGKICVAACAISLKLYQEAKVERPPFAEGGGGREAASRLPAPRAGRGVAGGAEPRAPSPGRMRLAAPLLLLLLAALPGRGRREPPAPGPPQAAQGPANATRPPPEPPGAPGNHSGARVSLLPALLRDLSALKAAVIGACVLSAGLIGCLLLRVCRSGKRIKKTRKYDIITTPAERVEMAPLNEDDDDDDEDSTVFDVKYR
ncbi:membrane protein FAM174B [Dermochelys coriacea]|uniref:membrane protein FAM174B n=1 Tax=Dermochelys coriacea TaxID=27794 RepID=UPI001CA8B7D2|nr:membrane protein FAM174B [Dermochelys coriacea]